MQNAPTNVTEKSFAINFENQRLEIKRSYYLMICICKGILKGIMTMCLVKELRFDIKM